MASRHKPVVPDELLDRLLGGSDALEAFQSGDLVQDLKKALAERILNAELDQHLDDEDEQSSGNHRNGHSRKRVLTDDGRMELSIPRDRQGRFDPKLVEKHCRRLPGFDDKVILMYARGKSAREIQGRLGFETDKWSFIGYAENLAGDDTIRSAQENFGLFTFGTAIQQFAPDDTQWGVRMGINF